MQNRPATVNTLTNSVVSQYHRYFSAHRAPIKLSFLLNRHLIFALYSTKFHEIPFRGRLPFGLVFDLVQTIIRFTNYGLYVCVARLVQWAFDLKICRSRFDPARTHYIFFCSSFLWINSLVSTFIFYCFSIIAT